MELFLFKYFKRTILLLNIAFFSIFSNSYSTILQPTAIDSRIKTLVYSPNEIYQLKFMVGYQSVIEFENDEKIKYMSFGDASPWIFQRLSNKIFLKPIDPDVKTNLFISTSKREYLFEIFSSSSDENTLDDELIFKVRFFYPEIDPDLPVFTSKQSISNQLKMPEKKTEININKDYSVAGIGQSITPQECFDDGNKTYIKFPNNNEKIPIIYKVDSNGREFQINYEIKKGYLVIQGVHLQISLRSKSELLCIFNEKLLKIVDRDEY